MSCGGLHIRLLVGCVGTKGVKSLQPYSDKASVVRAYKPSVGGVF